jgi:hypothetical protein
LSLTGCAGPPPPSPHFPEITFTQLTPFRLDVARVEVVSKFQPPARAPHIESDMPVSPETALRRWVQDRLQATGTGAILRVVIRDAAATETPLKTDQSLTGMFKKEQAARADVALDVALQILDDHQFVRSEVTGKVDRSRTEPEGQKLNERDKLLYEMVDELIRALNTELDPSIQDTFGPWLGKR